MKAKPFWESPVDREPPTIPERLRVYPRKRTEEENKAAMDAAKEKASTLGETNEEGYVQPAAVMPEGIHDVSVERKKKDDSEAPASQEKSWADLVEGASPSRWGTMTDGTRTAGGPIKHSLCPGCLHYNPREEQCNSAMPEALRNNPNTTSCMNARPIGDQ